MGWRRRSDVVGSRPRVLTRNVSVSACFLLLLTSVVLGAKINQCPMGSNPPPFAVAASICARAESSSASTFILSK